VERIGRHPERLSNLYFAYLFVVRAVAKARDVLLAMDLSTGNPAEDAATKALLALLTEVEAPSVLRGFDERAMFHVTPEDLRAPPRDPQCAAEQKQGDVDAHGMDDLIELQV
jgi:hypothetical protein